MPKKKNVKPKTSTKNSRYLRRRRVSPLKFAFWLILLLLSGFVVYVMYRFFFDKSFDLDLPVGASAESSEVKELKTSDSDSKDSKEKLEKESSEPSDNKTPEQYEGENPNSSASLTGALTASYVSGNSLVLRVNIDQYLTSGTCTLRLENSGSVVEKTAAILPTASTSSCEGFDVPVSELSSGSWTIKISLSSAEKTGEITGEVKI
ncbi:hypothetical protein IJH66_02135 [Candidatus Saccharibacteria bacterium]|nr:hypothetical protein [Candidatus Saccharibacteria bacterium]